VAVQVAEGRLEVDDALAVERDIHAEDTVRRGVVWPHGDFEQFALAIRLNNRWPVPALQLLRPGLRKAHATPGPCSLFLCACARLSTSSCAVGSYSKSSGST